MWELLEAFVYYVKHRGWWLPFPIILILIIIVFLLSGISTSSQMQNPPLESPTVTSETEKGATLSVAPLPIPFYKEPLLREQASESQKETPPVNGSVSQFKTYLVDALKVEGLDPEIAERIFRHIRAQLDTEPGTPYELSDSVKAVMPELDDAQVDYYTNLISKLATEAFDRTQN